MQKVLPIWLSVLLTALTSPSAGAWRTDLQEAPGDEPDELINRERLSMRFSDATDFDLDFRSPESAI